eukprot:UN10507
MPIPEKLRSILQISRRVRMALHEKNRDSFIPPHNRQMKPPTIWEPRIKKSFWTTFLSPKTVFCIFSFWVDKMMISQ